MTFHENINWLFDPSTWLWAALIIIVLVFVGTYFKVIIGKNEP